MSDQVPEGYEPLDQASPFNRHIGPYYARVDQDGTRWRALKVADHHCNNLGVAHGGLYMAMADGLIANTVNRETGAAPLTVRMTSDFLSIARRGDWLEGCARLDGVADGAGFGTAELYVAGRMVFAAKAVFKIMERHSALSKRS